MYSTIGKLLPLSTPTTYRLTMPSNTSLILIGVVLVILIVAIVGGVLYLRKQKTAKRSIPIDTETFILPRIPQESVATAFSQHETPLAAPTMPDSASAPMYRSVPSAPPETPAPIQTPTMMLDGYTSQGTPLKSSVPSTTSSSPDRLPDTPRPHPQVSRSNVSPSHQKQSGQDAVLEAMIRQAQRGIFATPGKDDLS
jgi:uncharacterized membrane protein